MKIRFLSWRQAANSCPFKPKSNATMAITRIMYKRILSGYKSIHPYRHISYVQGHSPRPGIREYFYYINHHGQLYLDDCKVKNFISCFKDKEFLHFFFKRLKVNSGKYSEDFPFVSPCGIETNFIRCDDQPLVITDIINSENDGYILTFNGMGPKIMYPFEPSKLCMLPKSGRVYHPGPSKAGGIALLSAPLTIQYSSGFGYPEGTTVDDPPSSFKWKDTIYQLDNELWNVLKHKNIDIDE